MPLTSHEIELLESMAGERESMPWGAWVSVCLESLQGHDLVCGGPRYIITQKGRELLTQIKRERAEGEVMGV